LHADPPSNETIDVFYINIVIIHNAVKIGLSPFMFPYVYPTFTYLMMADLDRRKMLYCTGVLVSP